MVAFEEILATEKPDFVGVVGDVNSTIACAVTTAKSYVLPQGRTPRLIHIESGLRSHDRLMPEEINRLVTDAISDHLFTTEHTGTENLLREGVPADRIHFAGNVMVDSLCAAVDGLPKSHFSEEVLGGESFGLVTLHRPSNVDEPEMLQRIIDALSSLAERVKLLMPVHPRTRARWKVSPLVELESLDQLKGRVGPGLFGLPPLGYHDFLRVPRDAKFVITDSGGVQEETTVLGVPCLTLRDNTERPITVEVGTNELLGRNPEVLAERVDAILAGQWKKGQIPPGWDGKAAERIVQTLAGLA